MVVFQLDRVPFVGSNSLHGLLSRISLASLSLSYDCFPVSITLIAALLKQQSMYDTFRICDVDQIIFDILLLFYVFSL